MSLSDGFGCEAIVPIGINVIGVHMPLGSYRKVFPLWVPLTWAIVRDCEDVIV